MEALNHFGKSVGRGVASGARRNGNGELAFGDGSGNGGHAFDVSDHLVEIFGEETDFVIAMNVDGLIDISGITDFAGDGR